MPGIKVVTQGLSTFYTIIMEVGMWLNRVLVGMIKVLGLVPVNAKSKYTKTGKAYPCLLDGPSPPVSLYHTYLEKEEDPFPLY